ncbi:MAG TPA: ribonuclease III [Clostridia bacterium]|nr:ribonuclease III [Clostridia bacterium]
MQDLEKLQKIINYTFKDESMLLTAMSHSSYTNEAKGEFQSNERLEFLGDSVLGFITADYFYRNFTHQPEGDLTRLRSATVCEKSLCGFAQKIGLGDFILLGKGEIVSEGNKRPSILADAFEALIAAIYIDGGFGPAKDFVLQFVEGSVKKAKSHKDYKTILQEVVQRNPEERVEYVLVNESGPDHDKCFEVEVHINSNIVGKGVGKSKKMAEQHAAKQALELMGI